MSSIIDNLNTTTQTGKPNSHRAVYRFGSWSVESTDNSGVWVCADPNPGRTYDSMTEAVDEAKSLAAALDGTYLGAFGVQSTLAITAIRREPYLSVVTVCEVNAAGERDGFEDVRVLHRDLDASDDDAGDIDAALAAIARERNLRYE